MTKIQDAFQLPAVASSPRYDRVALDVGIAHIGVGNFHRSHMALYLHNYLQEHDEDWMIHGILCLDNDRPLFEAMQSQDCLYSLTERSGTADVLKIVGSMKAITHAPTDAAAALAVLTSDSTKIISLTITEKGYYYDAAGNLDVGNPQVSGDLSSDGDPKTAFGWLFKAAQERMRNAGQPVTVMSCDNLPGNGHLTKRLLLQFADAKDAEVAAWMRSNMTFPNAMVDRITPVTTTATKDLVAGFGIEDECPVMCESYLQWVIEDDFINSRPKLEKVGAQFTNDVEPYELMKVRLLNGSHSALSYISYLLGHRDVDQAMADPLVATFVHRYMDDDITASVPMVAGVDLEQYKATLRTRFANPAVRDQVQRLAMDGSAKIKNSIAPVLEHQVRVGGSIDWIAFALAAWYRYLRGTDETGAAIELSDPMAETLGNFARAHPDDPSRFLAVCDIFNATALDPRVVEAVTRSLREINELGVAKALENRLADCA